jgi:hypothetical protein
MAEIPKVHRVKSADLQTGAAIEKSEHPWMSDRMSRKVARDHLQKNPDEYKEGEKNSRVILVMNQNIKVKPNKPKPKKEPPSNTPGWIPQNMRLYG